MYPELFHIGFLHTYGALVALGFLAALWVATKLAARERLDVEAVTNLGIYCALAAIAGAKLMMLAVDFRYYLERPADFFSLATLQAGGVFYGGLIAALAVSWWYMRRKGLPLLKTSDVFAPAIALGHGIGRLGCFSAGCCWGVACDRPWAVTFTDPAAARLVGVPLDIALHPTQLYEAFAEFLIFGFLLWRIRRPHAPGRIIGLYLMLYSTARFIVEFYRFHEQGNVAGGPLDTSQYISMGLFALGAWWFTRSMRAAPQPAPATR
jgi:phosphatidylglycerol---prolipoprotein diacylglyceryl transferase